METVGTIQRRVQEGGVVSCKICGTPTLMLATQLCDSCWEMRVRLRDFVATPEGLAYAKDVIAWAERGKT